MTIKRDGNIFKKFELSFWQYYLDLEKDFLNTKKYVDFSTDNSLTFSLEFLKLYQAVCGEIDAIGKVMAKYANNNYKIQESRGIEDWWQEIQNDYFLSEGYFTPMNPSATPNIYSINDYKCYLLDYFELQPWKDTNYENNRLKTPSWWSDYNKVKHKRITTVEENKEEIFYRKANLKNVSNAIAGLYVLEKAFMDTVGTKDDLEAFASFSQLFVKRKNLTSKEMDQLLGW